MIQNSKLSIIIVTFNSEKHISNCLSRLIISTKSIKGVNIIIIDNNSLDNTVKKIRSSFLKKGKTNISLFENKKNIGFAEAVNNGILLCESDNYLLVNPDILVNKETIKKVLECQLASNADIVGLRTKDVDNHESGSYFRFPNIWVGLFDFSNLRKLDKKDYWHNYFYCIDKRNIKNDFEVDIVTGGFMLIRNRVVKKIGLFDAKYFMYLEDVDFCLRAHNAGFKIYICNEFVTHIGGASSNNKDRVNHGAWKNSRKRYFLKHFGITSNLVIQVVFALDDMLISVLRYIKNEN